MYVDDKFDATTLMTSNTEFGREAEFRLSNTDLSMLSHKLTVTMLNNPYEPIVQEYGIG